MAFLDNLRILGPYKVSGAPADFVRGDWGRTGWWTVTASPSQWFPSRLIFLVVVAPADCEGQS